MPSGYHGSYLRIDVSSGGVEHVPLAESVLRQYIGGSGLGTRLLLDTGGATVDALSPDEVTRVREQVLTRLADEHVTEICVDVVLGSARRP